MPLRDPVATSEPLSDAPTDARRPAKGDGATFSDTHTSFLRALADRSRVCLIVHVPMSRAGRPMWIGPPGADADVVELEARGRALLARLAGSSDAGASGNDEPPARFAFTTIQAAEGDVVGVLALAKKSGEVWTDTEQALLEFANDFYAEELTALGRRPLPRPAFEGARLPAVRPSPLERGMRSAPTRGELFLLYQPEVDLHTGAILAVEALVRWDHPALGPLGPESFIALAEKSDLITILGTWVVEESLREFASWLRDGGNPALQLRVNVSPTQLAGNAIVDLFATTLAESGLRGEQVCVEITELSSPADFSTLQRNLEQLRHLGIRSAIDDLAMGHSTLSRLRTLPVDAVKIDRSIVSGLEDDWRAQAIVRAIVTLGAELGVEVVAEGVETAGEAAELRRLGCLRAQGHLFARPLDGPALRDLLARGQLQIDL